MSKESDERKRRLNGTVNKTQYEIQKASNERYLAKFDNVVTRVPKGEREKWKEFASQNDTSLQKLIITMMHNAMDKAGFDYTLPKEDET